jgi:hypothetical protein
MARPTHLEVVGLSKIMIGLQTDANLSEPEVARRVWKALDTPLIAPQGHGTTEDAPEAFSGADAATHAAAAYEANQIVFVRGEKGGFVAMFQPLYTGWGGWTFWINRGEFEQNQDQWLEWLFALCKEVPIFFGYSCDEQEFNAKHEEVEDLGDDMSAEGSVGVSAEELERYLPGIYWLTLFGADLVEHFGEDKLKSVEGTIAHDLGDKQIALQLDEPVRPSDMPGRLAREREVTAKLGEQYFFDRERPAEGYEPVPALAAKLQSIRGDGA